MFINSHTLILVIIPKLLLLLLLLLLLFIYRGVKVEELDIDIGTELQESTPLRDPTKEPTEKVLLEIVFLILF